LCGKNVWIFDVEEQTVQKEIQTMQRACLSVNYTNCQVCCSFDIRVSVHR